MNKLMVATIALTASTVALAQSGGTTETDARGVPVVSAPASAPPGANQIVTVPDGASVTVNPNQASVFTPVTASGEIPACSKSVTDHCTQTYEGHGGGKKMMNHRHMHGKYHIHHMHHMKK
ncbi:MAG: hypothetical protein ABIO85_02020 [Sphingomicrobium sp.]